MWNASLSKQFLKNKAAVLMSFPIFFARFYLKPKPHGQSQSNGAEYATDDGKRNKTVHKLK